MLKKKMYVYKNTKYKVNYFRIKGNRKTILELFNA